MTGKAKTPTADSLFAAASKAATGQDATESGTAEGAKARGLPPVHLWNPAFCGDLDMRIARDGTWYYLGTPIGRPALVKLFSNILKLEEGRYYLVTPVEKVGITVEDAPFVAVDFQVTDPGTAAQAITFTTQVGDTVTAGPDHPLRVETDASGAPSPYVMVRRGLEARIDRKSFYRLVELGEHHPQADLDGGRQMFGLRSQGVFFPLIASDALEG